MGSQWDRCSGQTTSRRCPRLPSGLTPETILSETSSAEMPPNHRLLSSQSCKGSQIRRHMQTGLADIHERESPASALLHKQNSCTLECQFRYACPARRPALDGQIGINLGRMGKVCVWGGGTVEVTPSHYREGGGSKREQRPA